MTARSNSFLRFALRCLAQLIYLMPRTSSMLPDAPANSPFVGGVVGTNLLCIFCHLYFARPQAGEATRGYLHGGLMLDFVGQKAPSSKLPLFLMDFMILGFQLIALAATLKRRELAKSKGSRPNAISNTTEPSSAGQDHDAEERGILRSSSTLSPTAEPSNSQSLLEVPEGSCRRQPPNRALGKAETFWSGQSTVAELYIFDTLKEKPTAAAAVTTTHELQRQLRRSQWRLNMPFRS
jgi:Fungal domain of unknown function (DUF1746)